MTETERLVVYALNASRLCARAGQKFRARVWRRQGSARIADVRAERRGP